MSAKTIHTLSTAAIASTDELPFWDISASSTKKVTALNLLSLMLGAGVLGITYADPDGTVTDHGDTAQPGSIANICTAASGSPVLIACIGEKSFPFLTTYTIPTNATLMILTGAQLDITVNVTINGRVMVCDDTSIAFDIATGIVLTINGPAAFGRFQVFTGSGAGDVVFGSEAVDACYVEWWGISGTNDSAAVQAAIDAAPAYTGKVILPPQSMQFNVTIDKAIHLAGSHQNSDSVYYRPYTTTVPVITMGNTSSNIKGMRLSQLPLQGSSTGEMGILINGGADSPILEKITARGFTSYAIKIIDEDPVTGCGRPTLRDIYITGTATGHCIVAENVSFYLDNADLVGGGIGSGASKALKLTNAICYQNRTVITASHYGGIELNGVSNGSSIWRSGCDIMITPVALMTLRYIGTGSAATVSIEDNDGDGAPDLLTTSCTGAGGDNLSLDLNTYTTITSLVSKINTDYSAAYTAVAAYGSDSTLDLDLITGSTDIKPAALGLYAHVGIENTDSTEADYFSWVRGFGWGDLTIKNKDGITIDWGGADLRTYDLSGAGATIGDLDITGIFKMPDESDNLCPITVYKSGGHWYLDVDFSGTHKKVELT